MSTIAEQLAAIVAEIERHKQTVFCSRADEDRVRRHLASADALNAVRLHTSNLCPDGQLWIVESEAERQVRSALPVRDASLDLEFPRSHDPLQILINGVAFESVQEVKE